MWRTISNTSYHINVTISDKTYKLFITDFVKLWSCKFSQRAFLAFLLKDNDGLEIDQEELLDKGTKILLNPEKLSVNIHIRDSNLIVCLGLDFGYILRLNLNFLEESSQMFFQKITQPLLNIVQDLKQSENLLRELIIKKDEEITEYKTQGGKIKYTALQPYNDSEHMTKHQSYKKFFDSIQDPQSVFNKTIDCSLDPDVIKEEPLNEVLVKQEPSSENFNSSRANNTVTTSLTATELKYEAKPFVAKKKRLNI